MTEREDSDRTTPPTMKGEEVKEVGPSAWARKYTYTLHWDDEDKIFVARVEEFRSLAAHGKTQEEALSEIHTAVTETILDLMEHHEPIPMPKWRRGRP